MKIQPDVRNLADPLDAIDILEAQLAEVTDQRDELLAAAKDVIDQWPGEANAFPQLERAIAKCS